MLVVEHDTDMIRSGDYLVDLGLGAGTRGGKVVYAGPSDGIAGEQTSLTAKYLRGDLAIPVPATRRKRLPQSRAIRLLGAAEHNLKAIDVDIPINLLTCVTGVSGSGKSTLVHDVLYAAIKRAKGVWDKRVGTYDTIDGLGLISDVVLVDQAPIGRTPRSNPVTYLKAFDPIRELFASTRGRAVTGADGQPLFVQRSRRALRRVRGGGGAARGNAVPGRCLRAVRALRRQAVQARRARGALPTAATSSTSWT